MLLTTLLADPILLHPRPRAQQVTGRRARAVRPPTARGTFGRTRALLPPGRLVAAALVILVAAALAFLRVWPPLATVMSASMAPTINTGDMVVLERLRGPARIGDIVAVSVPDEARSRYGYPPVVIHRVVSIAPDGQVRTRGDARPDPDPFTVPRTALTTKVVAHIPAGGRIVAFFHSGPGLLWLAFGAVLFLGLPLLDRQRDAQRREAHAAGELRTQLESVATELSLLRAEQLREQAEFQRRVEAAQREASAELADRLESLERAIVAPTPATPRPRARPDVAWPRPISRPAPRAAIPPRPAYAGRWDAPPPAGASPEHGWAARPATPRFGRGPGRLVAASAF